MLMRKESSLAKLTRSLQDRKLDEDDSMDTQGIDEDDVCFHDYDAMPKHIRHRKTQGRKEGRELGACCKATSGNSHQDCSHCALNGHDFGLAQLCMALNLENFEKCRLLEML
jgi:hypothetical protein